MQDCFAKNRQKLSVTLREARDQALGWGVWTNLININLSFNQNSHFFLSFKRSFSSELSHVTHLTTQEFKAHGDNLKG